MAVRWHVLVGERHRLFYVRGTELAVAMVPGMGSRFQLCDHRTITQGDSGIEYDREICVRDAASVSDAEVKDGIRPRIVARFPSAAEAVAWCAQQP